MTTPNLVPFLQSGSDPFALTLAKEGSAMVPEAYRTKSLFANPSNPHLVWKNETSGITSRFVRKAWTPRPDNYTPGAGVVGQAFGFNQYNIQLDSQPILGSVFVPKHLKRISDFEVVKPNLQGLVDENVRETDRRAFLMLHKASRQSTAATDSNGVLTMHNGANRLTVQDATGVATAFPTSSTGAANFRRKVAALRKMARDDDLPDEGSDLYITTYIAQVLSEEPSIYDVQFSQGQNPNNLVRASVGMMEGFNVFVVPGTDRMRSANINSTTGTSGFPTKYHGNYSYGDKASAGEPVALACFRGPEGTGAIGLRQVGPVDVEMQYQIGNQGDQLVVTSHIGFDILDPYLVGSIEVTSD